MTQDKLINSPRSGAGYFMQGFKLIRIKGIRRFVFVPLIVNLVLFSFAFYYLIQQLDVYMGMLDKWLPEWLSWLSFVLWPIAIFTILISFSFLFSAIANWIAAPFNGLLSEKVEAHLSGYRIPDTGFKGLVKDIPRTLGREWIKLKYYLPRALGFLLLYLFLPVIGQILWFIFVGWMMAVQYKDYPFDNHKISFNEMKNTLKSNQGLSYSFGLTASVFSMIPIVNLIVMPVAICGSTSLWVDHYQKRYID